MDLEYFKDYVWGFYGPEKIMGKTFNNSLTREELDKAVELRMKNQDIAFDGDSFDREIVRDIMLALRGEKNTLLIVTPYLNAA